MSGSVISTEANEVDQSSVISTEANEVDQSSVISTEANEVSGVEKSRPMRERYFYVYILTNIVRTVLYIGVTNDLLRRVYEHQQKTVQGFTNKYHCDILIYHEQYATAMDAIEREKQLKRWNREKKLHLIKTMNPALRDLYPELC